jgi:hypothetical protein
MSLAYVGYRNVTQAAAVQVKTGPAKFYGLTVTASTSGTVTIYDNTSAAGTVLFTKSSLVVGDVIHFGGVGLAANTGLHVVCGGTATVNVMFQ